MNQSAQQGGGIYIVRIMDGSEEILCNPVVTRFPQDTTRREWAFKGPMEGMKQLRLRGKNEENRFEMADEFQAWNYRLLKAAYDDGKFPMFRMTFTEAGEEARIKLNEQRLEMDFKSKVFAMDDIELSRACGQCDLPNDGNADELRLRLLALGYDIAYRKMSDKFSYAKVLLLEGASLGIFQDTNNSFSVSIGAKGLSQRFTANLRLGSSLMDATQLLHDNATDIEEVKRMIALRRESRAIKEQDAVPPATLLQSMRLNETGHDEAASTVIDKKAETDQIINTALRKGVVVKTDGQLLFTPTGGAPIVLGKSKAEVLVWRESNELLFDSIKELVD